MLAETDVWQGHAICVLLCLSKILRRDCEVGEKGAHKGSATTETV
jgi:hypothetical protein